MGCNHGRKGRVLTQHWHQADGHAWCDAVLLPQNTADTPSEVTCRPCLRFLNLSERIRKIEEWHALMLVALRMDCAAERREAMWAVLNSELGLEGIDDE